MKRAAPKRRRKLKFNNPQHHRLLSIFFTGIHLRIRAREFFDGHGITDTQFNVLSLIYDHAADGGGLSQVDLSRMLLVNRSNITSLIDRMERDGFVKRIPDPADRRRNVVQLTPRGRKTLFAIEDHYAKEVKRIMSALKENEQRALEDYLARISENL